MANASDRNSTSTARRAALLGHRAAVIWLTGLPGSGKSTLATALEQRLLAAGVLAAIVDGDVLRAGLTRDLGFSLADRRENIRRAAELALGLAQAGVVAIGALISPMRDDRSAIAARVRQAGVAFAEVFVNAPLAICEQRDPKGHYRRARAGQIPEFTGVDSPYEAPLYPDLEVRTDLEPIERSVEKLAQFALAQVRPEARA
jgi:bifunctional enzyme CysN/CysC